MAEDGAIATSGSVYGYTDAELDAMPLWLVAVRLGFAEGSDGYPKGRRDVMTPADRERQEEYMAERSTGGGKKGKIGKAFGRFNAKKAKPQYSDPGRVIRGDDARSHVG
jgi:hypothetical protein